MSLSTRIREHLRSNIIGYLALFVAMSGASYAASIGSDDIKSNAIRSKHIKAGNVQNSDIASNAIDSSKVADGSLAGADIDESSLDFSVLQSRVASSCAAGESIRAISQSGQVTCEADDTGSGTATDVACVNCIDDPEVSDTLTASNLVAGGSVVSDSEVDNNLTISGGSVSDGSLSPNVALLDRGGQTFTGSNTFRQGLNIAPTAAATNGVDVSDPDIVNAVNVGDNTLLGTTFAIDGTNFDVSATGHLTSAGEFTGPAGTAAVPTYSFSGDSNTGMFTSATDTLAFSTGGATQATINGTTVDIGNNNLTTTGAVTAGSATLSSMRLTPFATAATAGVPACAAGTEGQVYYDSDFNGAPTPDRGLVSCNGTAYVWVGDGTTAAD